MSLNKETKVISRDVNIGWLIDVESTRHLQTDVCI